MAEVIDLGDQKVPVETIPSSMYAAGGGGSVDGKRIATSNDRVDVQRLAKGEHGRTAAALAAGNIISSFIAHPTGGAQTVENAERVMGEIVESLDGSQIGETHLPAGPELPYSRTDSGLFVVEEPEAAPMPTDYELPDAYAFLNEPDEPEADDDLELPPAAAIEQVELDEDDLADPRIRQLHEQAKAAEKSAAHERGLRLKASRPQWEQEAERVFRLGDIPLLDADDLRSIKADSHRDFLRQAKVIADRNKKAALRFAPASPAPVQRAPEIISRDKQEMWGQPPAGQPPADLADNKREARMAKARQSGRLSDVIREMISSE